MPKPLEIFIQELINNLRIMFPNAECELNYNNYYELVIAVVLSAQTTDISVNKVTKELFKKYHSFEELANADINDVENIIKSIGLYRRKAKNIVGLSLEIINLKYFPNTREELMKLPGVGRKTANVILAEYFSTPAIAVDTHVKRVSERLKIAQGNVLEIEKQLMELFDEELWCEIHLKLVLLGRYICKARNPNCEQCLMKCQL